MIESMETREKIIDSLAPVLVSPTYLSIDTERIKTVARELLETPIPPWDNNLQLLGTAEETTQYYFFLDSINFCFWALKGEKRWEYKVGDQWIAGYYAFSRAIKDAFLRDHRFFDAGYLNTISEEDFRGIFAGGRNELLLVPKRHAIIRENFSILQKEFAGKAINLLEQARRDTDELVNLLVEHFPSLRDIVDREGKKLYFLKRAQIFPSDLFFSGIKSLRLSNLDHLTVFADYKLPQILESLGILKYVEELNTDITTETLIPENSLKEIELRAGAIIAAEKIRDELELLGRTITTNELDWILWVQAKRTNFIKPHHRTLTTFY